MSQRGKRQPNRTDDGSVPTKRRKCRPTPTPTPTPAEDEEATTLAAAAAAATAAAAAAAQTGTGWTPRPLNDLKISSIYNRSATEAPAEGLRPDTARPVVRLPSFSPAVGFPLHSVTLFRKDLISAMKLPDSEPLSPDEYWIITDQWKQEWERGVQVPVNPDSLPEATVTVNQCGPSNRTPQDFKLPKSKYIRITKDEFFTSEEHFLSNTPAKAEKACSYDLDDCDVTWLQIVNGERALMGLLPISEDQLEHVIEELEIRCWEKVQTIVKTEEGLGIEYDENVICDVCRSPDSEEGNEMVFCDMCNICVHQACYGITTIPSGSWLCRTCALSLRPECVLCPNKGGAMKCTRSGQKWAHVSCALWIPEVSIGCVEKMEPITKISSIPQSRWALICVLCRERVGACIQCSVKTCKTAYHVTCAFKHGLEMRAIIEDENADDGVKLRSYCQKHSVTSKKEKSGSASDDDESKRKKRKDMTSEEKNQARAAKLQEIEAEFDKHVSIKDITQHMDVDTEGLQYIYNYWKLKRKAGFNKPLLPPKHEDVDILSRQQEQADIEKMKMFVQLRQDLERVRNLCYMVSRREKLSRSFFRMREQTFHKQVAVLGDASCNLKSKEIAAVIEANHGPSIYDKLYSQPSVEDQNEDFEVVLARIAGISSPIHPSSEEKNKLDLNGLVKCSSDKKSLENPYKRLYFNGATRHRNSLYSMSSSSSETEAGNGSNKRMNIDISNRKNLNKCVSLRSSMQDSVASTSEDEEKVINSVCRSISSKRRGLVSSSAKRSEESRSCKRSILSRIKIDTSSEEEAKQNKNLWQTPCNRTLRQMERELGDKVSGSDDSEELLPITGTKYRQHSISAIYSDSESDVSAKEGFNERNEDKSSSNTPSDSQQHVLRTKAAVKEFSIGIQSVEKSVSKNHVKFTRVTKKSRDKSLDSGDDDSIKDKENVKSSRKKELDTTELIVPQRQAAKKATESMRGSQSKPKDQIGLEQEGCKTTSLNEDTKMKQKSKFKMKDGQELKVSKEGKLGDVYDFEKDSDAQEILAYVPQRQAAKKAAAHIKSGSMVKVVPSESDQDGNKNKRDDIDSPVKSKKEGEHFKLKKDSDSEKSKSMLRNLDSRGKSKGAIASSSSSSCSTSDSSSSDSEDIKDKPDLKTMKKDSKSTGNEKRNSADSNFLAKEDSEIKDKKIHEKKSKSATDWPFLDKEHQSSSGSCVDSESEENIQSSKKSSVAFQSNKSESSKSKEEGNSAKLLDSITSKTFDSSEKKGPNSKLAGKKFKKAPDKKLKTSDRRPECEFQPPVSEREKLSKVKNKLFQRRKYGCHDITASDDGNRIRNSEARSGDIHGSKNRDNTYRETFEKESASGKNCYKSSSPRIEELSKCTGNRESDSEKRVGKDENGEQSKVEARKRKPSEKLGPQGAGIPGHEEERDGKKTKEKSKSSDFVSASTKKVDKKVTESESSLKEQKLIDDKNIKTAEHSKVLEILPQINENESVLKESPTPNLEKEIAQRKAERDIIRKSNNKGSLDKLFEKREKTLEKILSSRGNVKELSDGNDKSNTHHKLSEKSESLKNYEELHVEKDKGDFAKGDEVQEKSSNKDAVDLISKEHRNFDRNIAVISQKDNVNEIISKDTIDKKTHQDIQSTGNVEEKKKDKTLVSCDINVISNSSNNSNSNSYNKDSSSRIKYNSVIIKTEKHIKKDEKHSVIQKVGKHITNSKTLKESQKKTGDVFVNHATNADKTPEKEKNTSSEYKDSDDSEGKNKKKLKTLTRNKKLHSHHEPLTTKDKVNKLQSKHSTEEGNSESLESEITSKTSKCLTKKNAPETSTSHMSAPKEISRKSSKEIQSSRCAVSSEGSGKVSASNSDHKVSAQALNTLSQSGKQRIAEVSVDSSTPECENEIRKMTSRSATNSSAHPQRSIFSPQQQSKEQGVTELFDFDNDILAVDESVNDDGFSIPRDSEEMLRAPLSFSFSSEFLFKEDTKEDSARETLNLVEKLRLEYAKKSSTNMTNSDITEHIQQLTSTSKSAATTNTSTATTANTSNINTSSTTTTPSLKTSTTTSIITTITPPPSTFTTTTITATLCNTVSSCPSSSNEMATTTANNAIPNPPATAATSSISTASYIETTPASATSEATFPVTATSHARTYAAAAVVTTTTSTTTRVIATNVTTTNSTAIVTTASVIAGDPAITTAISANNATTVSTIPIVSTPSITIISADDNDNTDDDDDDGGGGGIGDVSAAATVNNTTTTSAITHNSTIITTTTPISLTSDGAASHIDSGDSCSRNSYSSKSGNSNGNSSHSSLNNSNRTSISGFGRKSRHSSNNSSCSSGINRNNSNNSGGVTLTAATASSTSEITTTNDKFTKYATNTFIASSSTAASTPLATTTTIPCTAAATVSSSSSSSNSSTTTSSAMWDESTVCPDGSATDFAGKTATNTSATVTSCNTVTFTVPSVNTTAAIAVTTCAPVTAATTTVLTSCVSAVTITTTSSTIAASSTTSITSPVDSASNSSVVSSHKDSVIQPDHFPEEKLKVVNTAPCIGDSVYGEVESNAEEPVLVTKIKKVNVHRPRENEVPYFTDSFDVPEPSGITRKEDRRDKSSVSTYISEGIGPYEYRTCEVQLDVPKVSIPGREKLDRCNSAQADERWVPPSLDFMAPHHSVLPHPYESIPPPLDCTSTPSPYADHRNRAKWADSEVLPIRRSSSSSAASTSSTSSHREDLDPQKHDDIHLQQHSSGVDITFQGLHSGISSFPSCSLSDAPPYHPYSEASPFVGPVALFPTSACPQLPFPSPGTPMFPPAFGASFTGSHSVLSVPKPPEDQSHRPAPCVATFTSSSHNMALTAAMVSPPVSASNIVATASSPVLRIGSPLTPASFATQESVQQLPVSLSPTTDAQSQLSQKQPELQKQQKQLLKQQKQHIQEEQLQHIQQQEQAQGQSQPLPTPLSFAAQVQSAVSLPPPPLSPSPAALPHPAQQMPLTLPSIPSAPALPPPSSPPPPPPSSPPSSSPPHQPSSPLRPSSPLTPSSPIAPFPPSGSIQTPLSLQDSFAVKPSANCNVLGKKSPVKPTRTSARVTSQLGKSPGKSPRQDNSSTKSTQNRVRESSSKRPSGGKISVSRPIYNQSRGAARRGRGRGRNQNTQLHQDSEYHANNTIHSKLVGTVYDLEFDDDSPSESVENLRAMRERRRSTDIHERKSDVSFLSKDSSSSPKLTSPQHNVQASKVRSYSCADVRELRPPSPLEPSQTANDDVVSTLSPVPNSSTEPFQDVVQPVLPGPVDMRTYSTSYEPNTSNNHTAYDNGLLGNFTSETAEQHVADFDDDMENELHSALVASKSSEVNQAPNEHVNQLDDNRSSHIHPETSNLFNNKVSLTDPRNQLKVKIKGPFLDANYAASTSAITPLAQQQATLPVLNPLDVSSSVIPTATTAVSSTSASSSGTSNLRRMRKKELLRQYWTQDMNMDDPAGAPTGQAMVPATTPPVNRTVITIPKAVASMTSIPTREDYKAVVDANMEKKRRKEKLSISSSVSRELRHLDVPSNMDDSLERRRSIGSVGVSSSAHLPDGTIPPIKRRGRPPKTTATITEPLAPKLKIKIGNSVVSPSDTDCNIEEKKLRIRPPKKRLMNVQMPSVDELKRESMKFRRRIMADFEEEEKKESKVVCGKRRKQRQPDSQHEVELIDRTKSEKVSAPKIVIRINKRVSGSASSAGSESVKSVSGENSAVLSRTEDISLHQSVATSPTESEKEPPLLSRDDESPVTKTVPADSNSSGKNGAVPENIRTSKVSPIRLKLARCQEGYVMKTQSHQEGSTSELPAVLTQNDSKDIHSDEGSVNSDLKSTLPVTKGCEVR